MASVQAPPAHPPTPHVTRRTLANAGKHCRALARAGRWVKLAR